MVRHVPILGILMIVNGSLVAVMGVLYTVIGPTLFAILQLDKQNVQPGDEVILSILSGVYIGCGAVLLVIGVLHIVSGIMTMRYRNRVLALITLFTNIPVVFTCYCAMTGLAVMIFGLIMLFNDEVTEAFRLVAQGKSVEEAVDAAEGRRRPRYSDYDDDDDRRDAPRSSRGGKPIDEGPPDNRIQPS